MTTKKALEVINGKVSLTLGGGYYKAELRLRDEDRSFRDSIFSLKITKKELTVASYDVYLMNIGAPSVALKQTGVSSPSVHIEQDGSTWLPNFTNKEECAQLVQAAVMLSDYMIGLKNQEAV